MFNLKVKLKGQTGDNSTKNVEIMEPLKHLSNFWTTLEMPLINCEMSLDQNQLQTYQSKTMQNCLRTCSLKKGKLCEIRYIVLQFINIAG